MHEVHRRSSSRATTTLGEFGPVDLGARTRCAEEGVRRDFYTVDAAVLRSVLHVRGVDMAEACVSECVGVGNGEVSLVRSVEG